VGDRAGEGVAYANLGCAYGSQGDFSKAIEYRTQHLAIAKEVGDRAGEGKAYGNLGSAYDLQGDYSKAIKHHTQHLAIAKEVGDRAGEGRAYGSLGNAYKSQGDFSKAIEYHAQHLAIAKEVGDRAGEGVGYADLGTCHMHLNEHVKAVAYFEAQHAMATSLKRVSPSTLASAQLARTLSLALTKLLDGKVTRRRRRAWMIECVRWQSGSRLPWMVVVRLQTCTWRTSPFMRAKRTRRWHISKSTSHGACNGDVTLAPGVSRRGARTRRCSRAAAAV
jgi:hypothetical protein